MNHEQPKLHQLNLQKSTEDTSFNEEFPTVPNDVRAITNQPLNPDMRHRESFTREEANQASGIPEKHPGYKKAIAAGALTLTAFAGLGAGGYAASELLLKTPAQETSVDGEDAANNTDVSSRQEGLNGNPGEYNLNAETGNNVITAETPLSFEELAVRPFDEFREYDNEARVGSLGASAEKYKSTIEGYMKEDLSTEQLALMNFDEPLPSDKMQYTDQQLMRDWSTSLYQVGCQGPGKNDYASKLLSLTVDPKLGRFDAVRANITGDSGLIDINNVVASYPLTENEFMGHTVDDSNRLLTLQQVLRDDSRVDSKIVLFDIVESNNNQSVVLIDSWEANDPKAVAALGKHIY